MKKFLAILAFLAFAAAASAWTAVYLSIPPAAPSAAFTVNAGDNADAVARRLKSEGFIRSVAFFKLAIRDTDLASKLQPGTYDLHGAQSYKEIAERLTTGGLAANEMLVRVIEGWDLRDIKDSLAKSGYAGAEKFYEVTGEPARDYRQDQGTLPADLSAEFDFLKDKPKTVSYEGYLFPDTYRIYKDATPKELVKKLLANFDKKFTSELRAKGAAHGRGVFDVVTLASILEQEVRGDADLKLVSDIFWRRLDAGMPLQADSTVNYVTRKGRASVSGEDTAVDSRYNTYKYPGLPLGPICNPGLAALRAAVEPTPNDNWYFLTDKEGNVHYGRSLDEHNKNKAKYLR